MKPRGSDRLIVALDLPTTDAALDMVRRLGGRVSTFKIGWEVFISGGWRQLIEALSESKSEFFVDLKLPGDIPTTISRVVNVCLGLPVKFITLSETVRTPTVSAARSARGDAEYPKFLVVTLFSSFDREEFDRVYGAHEGSMEDFIIKRSQILLDAGCDGLIASGDQIQLVKRHFPRALIVSPGIRLSWWLDIKKWTTQNSPRMRRKKRPTPTILTSCEHRLPSDPNQISVRWLRRGYRSGSQPPFWGLRASGATLLVATTSH